MNKKLFLIPLAAALMASCSNQDFDGDNTYTGETETRYLAVNIVDNSVGTRADNENDYLLGTPEENQVTNIRFYLFDKDGKPYGDGIVDATAEPISGTPQNGDNVEKKLQAVIVFEAPKANKDNKDYPIQLVAVVNPPTGLGQVDDLSKLQTTIADYQTDLTDAGKFVMTNSVYAATEGNSIKEHVAFTVTEQNIGFSKAAALANPVEIYVERVVAKAQVNVDTNTLQAVPEAGDNIYKITGDKQEIYDAQGNSSSPDIYLKLIGWDVTGTAKETRLVKKINPEWGGETFLGEKFNWGTTNAWNKSDYFRSFWAINHEDLTQDKLQFDNFKSITTSFDGTTPVYMMENAAKNNNGENPTYPTKLIVAGQLVNGQGKPVDLGWYAGSYYMQEDLMKVVLKEAKIFKGTTIDGATTYEPASIDELPLEFITTTAAGDFTANGTKNTGVKETINRYNCYAKTSLTEIPENTTYYYKKADGTYETLTLETLNGKLRLIDGLKVWTSGYTYYWLDITHLAPEGMNGEFGIVRNHVYDFKLSSFKGFGIPVLNDGETIYPEIPNDPEMMYIAARINILAWRLVSHDSTELGW